MAVKDWYKNLPPRTRIYLGFGVMAYAVAGMYISDYIGEKNGFVGDEQDIKELKIALPKITVVDKEKK